MAPAKKGRLLIVCLDAIGDYILLRTVLRELRFSARFARQQVTLLGNRLWRDLFETYDPDLADDCIWINPADYRKRTSDNLLPLLWRYRPALRRQRHKLRTRLLAGNFDSVLLPGSPRDPQIDQLLAGIAPAMLGVAAPAPLSSDRLFADLAPAAQVKFVFERNAAALKHFCGCKLEVPAPFVPLQDWHQSKSAVIFPGAAHWTRRWPLHRFAACARHLIDRHKLEVVIVSGASDLARVGRLCRLIDRPGCVRNPAGSGSLADLASTIATCRIVVSNDTCATHFAAVQHVPAICITNGISGRDNFWPYPAALGLPVTPLVKTPAGLRTGNLVTTQIRSRRNLCAIGVTDVTYAIDKQLAAGEADHG